MLQGGIGIAMLGLVHRGEPQCCGAYPIPSLLPGHLRFNFRNAGHPII